MKNTKLIAIILLLVGLGAGFGGGYFFRNYQISKMRANFTGGANGVGFQRFVAGRGGGPGGQNGGFRGGAVQGTILSMDDKSITVKLMDGSSKIVLFSDATTYSNNIRSTKTDLKVGSEVAVFGAPNTDGSVTASTVQLNPMIFRPQTSATPEAE